MFLFFCRSIQFIAKIPNWRNHILFFHSITSFHVVVHTRIAVCLRWVLTAHSHLSLFFFFFSIWGRRIYSILLYLAFQVSSVSLMEISQPLKHESNNGALIWLRFKSSKCLNFSSFSCFVCLLIMQNKCECRSWNFNTNIANSKFSVTLNQSFEPRLKQAKDEVSSSS